MFSFHYGIGVFQIKFDHNALIVDNMNSTDVKTLNLITEKVFIQQHCSLYPNIVSLVPVCCKIFSLMQTFFHP